MPRLAPVHARKRRLRHAVLTQIKNYASVFVHTSPKVFDNLTLNFWFGCRDRRLVSLLGLRVRSSHPFFRPMYDIGTIQSVIDCEHGISHNSQLR